MRILGHVAFFLLLGSICCKSNRNAKFGGKSPKKSGKNQAADVSQSPLLDAAPGRTGRGSGGLAVAGRNGAAAARTAGQQTDDMRLHFLKNNQVTCNDGTAAGFYLKESKGSRRWLLFLEGTGILSSRAEENPHWHNANIVFIPYCSSDVWSGTRPAPAPPQRPGQARERDRDANRNLTEYAFMGSMIIREVIKDLAPKGMKQAKVVMLSGTSAGGIGVMLNIERVASQLSQLGAEAQVRGLVDSGWFLESKRQRSPDCPEAISCSPEDSIRIGLRS
ncbi:Carboxylesterase notum2 [Takifugu flavidus]|uniref:Carboxylesterase notum2 n=1 Tax=Takifugu flavidus TaxID=433684 RepID=A0A5C6MTM4_9TELE|nr:Carboxylesterase notum2 [Takifugu flavidus]